MITPFVSVIIPTYNRAMLIGKAIDSVLQQTFADWELLVVDDGSTDNTAAIMGCYTDPRIKYIYQKNVERCAARNNGILQSAGRYITFLDSDDYYLPERLQLLHNEMEKHQPEDFVFYTGLQLYDSDSGVGENKDVAVSVDSKYDTIALSAIHSQQVCAHRNIFKGNLFNVALSVGEDMELWLRLASQYEFRPVPNQCTVVVVEHGDRSINVTKANPFVKQLQTLDVVFSKGHPGNNISASVKKTLYANSYFGSAKHYIYNRKIVKAAYWLLKSISAYPGHVQTKYKLNILANLFINPAKAEQLL